MLIGPMLQRLRATQTLEHALEVALADVVALHGAERGNIQLFDERGHLLLVEQKGFPAEFLRTFARVEPGGASVCGRAAARREPVHVPDVQVDPEFAPHRPLARAVPFRSVVSAPLVAPGGEFVGMVSVHFANPFTPSRLELATLSKYCLQLAGFLCDRCTAAELRARALGLAARIVPSLAPARG
jgi:GAF domain-containing protein